MNNGFFFIEILRGLNERFVECYGVVVDSFLGQGEALDCFNTKMQDAEATKRNLENLEMLQRMEVVAGIKEPNQKAELYKKVFGTCCDTPQTQILKP